MMKRKRLKMEEKADPEILKHGVEMMEELPAHSHSTSKINPTQNVSLSVSMRRREWPGALPPLITMQMENGLTAVFRRVSLC